MATLLQDPVSTVPGGGSAAIHVEDLRHNYGKRSALNGISFDVAGGEIFALLGPNGSGKTTLFRILSTLMMPTGGRAVVAGFDAARQPVEVRRRIGVVFQARSLDLKLTAVENLWHQGHLYGLHGAPLQSRVREMLDRVGLAERAKDRVETFSGGMQRRVELAKGLMHNPGVLLLDEPTTGLDPGARHDVWQYLQQLSTEERVSILVTTHLMDEAERCDRLAILHEGRIVALGTPAGLRAEIGGDVVVFESDQPEALASLIKHGFGVPASIIGDKVRLKSSDGHQLASTIVESVRDRIQIQSVSVSKPTLEDVFIDRTGHRFWAEKPAEEAK
ncbi:MAG TPA: ABC transporter ATP-binding protein [Terriglobales bacterium]